MNNKNPSIREKIIAATIECIEETGLQLLTIRSIGAKAGVNSAAINYYFGTKERLIEEALKRSLEEFKKIPEEILHSDSFESRARLEAFFAALLEGMIKRPRIVRAHLQASLFENNYDTPFAETLNSFLTNLLSRLEETPQGRRVENLRTQIIQAVSAVFFPGLMPGLFRYFAGLDFADPETRSSYVEDLAGRYFR